MDMHPHVNCVSARLMTISSMRNPCYMVFLIIRFLNRTLEKSFVAFGPVN